MKQFDIFNNNFQRNIFIDPEVFLILLAEFENYFSSFVFVEIKTYLVLVQWFYSISWKVNFPFAFYHLKGSRFEVFWKFSQISILFLTEIV